jgi:hypothetical protein
MSLSILRRLHFITTSLGIDFVSLARAPISLVRFTWDYTRFRRLLAEREFGSWKIGALFPCLSDWNAQAGVGAGHYFHQDILVARKIYEQKPARHADIGSSVSGFVAHLAVFRTVDVIDIRPLTTNCKQIRFRQIDMMKCTSEFHEAYDSVSCLHALEHFGLGRYGDAIDPAGYEKGATALAKLVRSGGTLYVSVPIGIERIEFNAHRVFSFRRVCELFQERFIIKTFTYIDDDGCIHEDVTIDSDLPRVLDRLRYGCGIWELCKF